VITLAGLCYLICCFDRINMSWELDPRKCKPKDMEDAATQANSDNPSHDLDLNSITSGKEK